MKILFVCLGKLNSFRATETETWQLLDFILGRAKMAVYLSRRNLYATSLPKNEKCLQRLFFLFFILLFLLSYCDTHRALLAFNFGFSLGGVEASKLPLRKSKDGEICEETCREDREESD